jgi:hypothetical protein
LQRIERVYLAVYQSAVEIAMIGKHRQIQIVDQTRVQLAVQRERFDQRKFA